MKKILLLLTALMLGAMGANAQNGGPWNCGDNNNSTVKATLSNGVLTVALEIPGETNPMNNYDSNNRPPWYNVRNQITSVIIATDVTNVGDYAFYGCTNLTSLTFSEGDPYRIGNYAFYNCSKLTSVTIPGNTLSIGDYAFADCSLTSLTIHDSELSSIGYNAFAYNNFTSLTILLDGLALGGYIFEQCSYLTSVTIANGSNAIGNGMFSECSALTSVTIPSTVTSIGSSAFNSCSNLASITIPGSVTSMGDYLFEGCSRLTSVTLGNGITTISNGMFTDGPKLTSITIPSTVTSIGSSAFYSNSSLTSITIPNSVTSIGSGAFEGCRGLISVTIGSGVTSIGSSAFYGCTALNFVESLRATPPTINDVAYFGQENSIATACLYVPQGAAAAYSVAPGWNVITCVNEQGSSYRVNFNARGGTPIAPQTVPSGGKATQPTPVHYGYTFGGWYTDEGCTNAWNFNTTVSSHMMLYAKWSGSCTNFTAYGTVDSMGWSLCADGKLTFTGEGDMPYGYSSWVGYNGSVTSAAIDNRITSLSQYAFLGCTGLTSVTIPSSVTTIGSSVFQGCTGLTSVTIPSSVTTIGSGAFSNCNKLTSVTIPSSVTSIGQNALWNCSGLTAVIFEGGNTIAIGNSVFNNCTAVKAVECLSTVPPSISGTGFQSLPNIAAVCLYVPQGAEVAYRTAPGWSAFTCVEEQGAGYRVTFNMRGGTPIARQIVPVGGKAVQPANPTHYGYTFGGWYTDENCTSAWDFNTTINSHTTLYAKWNGSCTNFTAYGTMDAMGWSLCNGKLTITGEGAIPNYSNGAAPWYSNRTSITSVVFDSRITTIGNYAFYYLTNTNSITIPNSVTTIGGSAFQGCTGLTSVTVGNSVTSISSGAFQGCSGLTSVTIPNSVTTIGGSAFSSTGLTSITIGSGVTTIGSSAFQNCELTSVTIPNSVTSIGDYAFQNCEYLASVTIGSNVTYIGNNAFYNCNDLTTVTVLSPVRPAVGTTIFGSLNLSSRTLNVPCGSLANYPNAAPWNFGTRQELAASNNNVVFNARGGTAVATQIVATGSKAIQPTNPTHYGYTFGGWYTEEACTTPWDFNTVVTNCNTMLYAKWNECGSFTAYGVTGTLGWSLCSGGTLTITGEGAIPSYSSGAAPWYSNRTSITSVVLDSRITTIGSYAFQSCTNVGFTSITIPGGVTSIGNSAFSGCNKLTSVTIPSSVTSIGVQAFFSCSNLTSVTIPEGVTNISNNAFSNCTSLTSITIPNSVTNIDYGAFYNCTSLTSATIKVTTINSNLFQSCTGLTSITIPGNVTSVGTQAFYGCTSLSSITSLRPTPPTAQSSSFTNVPSTCCLYVPQVALNDYRNATGWSYFTTCTQQLPVAFYTITFDTQEGSSVVAQQIEQGQQVQQPTNPTRLGYTFAGWYRDAQCTMSWNFAQDLVSNNLTLYAKWSQIFTVSFNAQGGSPTPAQQQVEGGQLAQQPSTNPTRNGYVFGGWYKEAVCTTPWNFAADVVPYSIILYAQWIPLFTVSFDAQGGSPSLTTQTVQEGQLAQQPAVPTRASYTFAGWYTNVAYTTAWSFATDVITANTTLYAKWVSNSATIFTVTFNSQSGSAVSSQQVEQGGNAAQPGNPVREGLTFGGWFKDQACTQAWDFLTEVVNANTTLYALWQCMVLFNPNGGSAVPAQLVNVGGTASAPTAPKHSNYNFVGWYTDLCLATPYSFGSAVQGNITLYAKWTPK